MDEIYLKKKSWLDAPLGLVTIKDTNEKKIIINKNCKFFVVVDLILFLGND